MSQNNWLSLDFFHFVFFSSIRGEFWTVKVFHRKPSSSHRRRGWINAKRRIGSAPIKRRLYNSPAGQEGWNSSQQSDGIPTVNYTAPYPVACCCAFLPFDFNVYIFDVAEKKRWERRKKKKKKWSNPLLASGFRASHYISIRKPIFIDDRWKGESKLCRAIASSFSPNVSNHPFVFEIFISIS